MKLWDIIRTVGTGIISTTVPGGALLVGAVNELLPEDKKLPTDATGDQVKHALNGLPPTDRARILEKEYDVDIAAIQESHSTVRTMLESDAKNPHTTRPYIAKHSFHVVAFTVVITILLWAYGILKADTTMVKTIVNGWPFLLAAIAPLVVLLQAYFGVLKKEHQDRLAAAGGQTRPTGIAGLITALVKK